jgi:hypothetical protein
MKVKVHCVLNEKKRTVFKEEVEERWRFTLWAVMYVHTYHSPHKGSKVILGTPPKCGLDSGVSEEYLRCLWYPIGDKS